MIYGFQPSCPPFRTCSQSLGQLLDLEKADEDELYNALDWLLEKQEKIEGSSRFCVISLTYIGLIDLCVLCVFVVRSTPSLGGMYLRIHFTHQTWESQLRST